MLHKLRTIALVIALLSVAIVAIYAQPWKTSHAAPPKKATPTPHGITIAPFSPNVVNLRFMTITTTLVTSKNDIWIAGSYCAGQFSGGSSCPPEDQIKSYYQHFDGSSWTVLDTPDLGGTDFVKNMYAVSPYDVYAVGTYSSGGQPKALIEHFDGSTWSLIPLPALNDDASINGMSLNSVLGLNNHDIYAVGTEHSVGFPDSQSVVEHYDGTNWTLLDYSNFASIDSLQRSGSSNSIFGIGHVLNTSRGRGGDYYDVPVLITHN